MKRKAAFIIMTVLVSNTIFSSTVFAEGNTGTPAVVTTDENYQTNPVSDEAEQRKRINETFDSIVDTDTDHDVVSTEGNFRQFRSALYEIMVSNPEYENESKFCITVAAMYARWLAPPANSNEDYKAKAEEWLKKAEKCADFDEFSKYAAAKVYTWLGNDYGYHLAYEAYVENTRNNGRYYRRFDSGQERKIGFEFQQSAISKSLDLTEIFVDGRSISPDYAPKVINGRLLLPMRSICESIGCDVAWDATSRKAIITRDSRTVTLTIGSAAADVNGKVIMQEVPAQIIDDRTYIPIRFISEAFDQAVTWTPMQTDEYGKRTLPRVRIVNKTDRYTDEQMQFANGLAMAVISLNSGLNNTPATWCLGGVFRDSYILLNMQPAQKAQFGIQEYSASNFRDVWRAANKANWGITDRKGAIDNLDALLSKDIIEELIQEGDVSEDTKAEIAWNLSRIVTNSAQFCAAGYVSYEEAMEYSMSAARYAQQIYSSFRDFQDYYLVIARVAGQTGWDRDDIIDRAFDDPKSILNTIPWDLDLEPAQL
jgi:hypothetical protein